MHDEVYLSKFLLVFHLLMSSKGDCLKEDSRIPCEPIPTKGNEVQRWILDYNITLTPSGFLSSTIASSKFTLPYPLSGTDKETGSLKSHYYHEVMGVKKTGSLVRFRSAGLLLIYHFLHGDAMIFHTIDPATKKYSETEIGFHTNKYYFVILPDTWFSINLPLHNDEPSSTLIGLTLVRGNLKDSENYIFPTKQHMLQKFPMHSEVINQIFNRSISY